MLFLSCGRFGYCEWLNCTLKSLLSLQKTSCLGLCVQIVMAPTDAILCLLYFLGAPDQGSGEILEKYFFVIFRENHFFTIWRSGFGPSTKA